MQEKIRTLQKRYALKNKQKRILLLKWMQHNLDLVEANLAKIEIIWEIKSV